MLHPRVDNGSNKRFYLTKIHANDFVSVSLLRLVLNSDVEDHLTLVVQADGWTTHLSITKA
jgi:hypothetical protein